MIVRENKVSKEIFKRLKNEVFIYPTDTIYGIGCDATNKKLVEEIRKIKQRDVKPFSVIAPSKRWILENLKANEKYVDKYLPGAYTLILEKRKKNFLNWISNNDSIGIRIPSNKFTKILQELKVPIVTTSVNLSGKKFANSIKEIDKQISKKVDLIIDGGVLSGKPSTLIIDGKAIER